MDDTSRRVVSRYLGRYLARREVSRTADRWKSLPKGWTEKSLKKFWDNLSGGGEHEVTRCIEQMTGNIDDPGAFCAAAKDRLEGKGWRSER